MKTILFDFQLCREQGIWLTFPKLFSKPKHLINWIDLKSSLATISGPIVGQHHQKYASIQIARSVVVLVKFAEAKRWHGYYAFLSIFLTIMLTCTCFWIEKLSMGAQTTFPIAPGTSRWHGQEHDYNSVMGGQIPWIRLKKNLHRGQIGPGVQCWVSAARWTKHWTCARRSRKGPQCKSIKSSCSIFATV